MDRERLEKQISFILEADKEKNIFRQTHISGYVRRENDAEHAWHMALMVYLLREYANEKIDLARAMMMALIHDVVEIDAGDTYAYDEEGLKTQKERERLAAERIFGLLPREQGEELRAIFDDFENYDSPEARFVHSMDNFQPLLLNDINGGGDWISHGVTREQIMTRHSKTALGSKDIGEYSVEIIDKNVTLGNLKP